MDLLEVLDDFLARIQSPHYARLGTIARPKTYFSSKYLQSHHRVINGYLLIKTSNLNFLRVSSLKPGAIIYVAAELLPCECNS